MTLSVKIDDYYSNDENGLWVWYLRNLRSGDFEELTTNKLKYTLLRRFLNSNLYNNKSIKNFNKNQKLLFISIPDKIHSDISILETFLKDYFHLKDLNNIKIQKLTKDHCYSHENHYLLIDTINNFNDPTFLNYVDPKRYNKFKNDVHQIVSTNTKTSTNTTTTDVSLGLSIDNEANNSLYLSETKITQQPSILITKDESNNITISQEKSSKSNGNDIHCEQNSSLHINNNNYNNNNNNDNSNNNDGMHSNTKNKITVPTNSSVISDDGESSIVLNFPRAALHHIRHSNEKSQNHKPIANINDSLIHLHIDNNYNNSSFNCVSNSHVFTPSGSEMMSINSFYNDNDINSYAKNISYNELGLSQGDYDDNDDDCRLCRHPLTRMVISEDRADDVTNLNDKHSIFYDDENEKNHLSDQCNNIPTNTNPQHDEEDDGNSFISSKSNSSYPSSNFSDIFTTSSTSSYYSILPSISINDKGRHFRLVLQSCLLYKENKEILTAIRQSNNAVNTASVDDDWILYDSQFNMNDLTILTLKDLFEFGHDIPKILFYSMVIVDNTTPIITVQDTRDNHNNSSNGNNNPDNIQNDHDYLDNKHHPEEIVKISEDINNTLNIQEESDDDIEQESPELLYDDNKGPQMYTPERIISNATTVGHRSIRTINTMGEWASRKKSNMTFDNESSEIGEYSPKTLQNDSLRVHGTEGKNKIARWKSVPYHNNNNDNRNNSDSNNGLNSKLNSNYHLNRRKKKYNDDIAHSGGERWRLKIKRFRRANNTKKDADDKICTIM